MFHDSDGTKSRGCHAPGQIHPDRWLRAMRKSAGLRVASVAAQERTDCVCGEDTRGCWVVLAAEGGRAVSRTAEINCGGAVGCAEGMRACGSTSSFQRDKIAKLELFLGGFDCSDLEWKLHQGALGNGALEQSADESWFAAGRTGVSSHLHNDHGIGAEGSGQELESSKPSVESGRFCAGWEFLRRRCGSGSSA